MRLTFCMDRRFAHAQKKKKYLTQRRADLEKQYREIGAALVKAGVVRRR